MSIDQDAELQLREGALDLAHHEAREKYRNVFRELVRKKFNEHRDGARAIAIADALAKAAYYEIHQHIYAETYSKNLANLQKFSPPNRVVGGKP